jgi:hypothetical protein
MSAAVPEAEMTSHFGERDVWHWRHLVGMLCDPHLPADLYAIERNQDGACHLADRRLTVPVCIYIAVDDTGSCLHRAMSTAGCSIVSRIKRHHAIPPNAAGLWVLPVRSDCPRAVLTDIETKMIQAYWPPHNVAHCPAYARSYSRR